MMYYLRTIAALLGIQALWLLGQVLDHTARFGVSRPSVFVFNVCAPVLLAVVAIFTWRKHWIGLLLLVAMLPFASSLIRPFTGPGAAEAFSVLFSFLPFGGFLIKNASPVVASIIINSIACLLVAVAIFGNRKKMEQHNQIQDICA